MPPEQWTILKLLTWTTEYLKSRQIEQPRSSAEILLAHTLGVSRMDLYLRYDQPLTSEELSQFKGLILRRSKKEPVAYITGKKGFWTLDLSVSIDVLIPRPETELIVETALSILSSREGRRFNVLDLGTGSGAIILALAAERPGHNYYAVDLCEKALAIATKNAQQAGLAGQITHLCGAWFEPVTHMRASFDLIVSNPPYIVRTEIDNLAEEVRYYEPRLALDGGPDGLDAFRHIIEQAPKWLAPGGWLAMEIGHDQAGAVRSMMEACGKYSELSVTKDYNGFDRMVRARIKPQH